MLLGVLVASLGSCAVADRKVARDAFKLLDKACVLLQTYSADGTVQEVCATEDELNFLVPLILSGRKNNFPTTYGDAKSKNVCQESCLIYCN